MAGKIAGNKSEYTLSEHVKTVLSKLQGSCHLGGEFGVVLSCCSAQFLKGEHHVLLQNVTVHVGIHVFLNEAQLPSTSGTHAAPDHNAPTPMLDCRQDTIFLVRPDTI